MEAIALIITKFSSEILQAQLAALSLFGSIALYWFLIQRRKKQDVDWVPASIVKEYLDRVAEDERQTRYRLFGLNPHVIQPMISAPPAGVHAFPTTGTPIAPNAGGQADPALLAQLEALRAQLAIADKRGAEFDKTVNGMKEEKKILEQKLKDLEAKGASAAAGGADVKELEDLKARLKEYEVIEDDLANLKKYQAENKALKEKLASLGGGATPAAPTAAAPAEGKKDESALLNEFEKMLAS